MKKIKSLQGIHTLALVIFSLCLMPLARAQDATLTLTVASNSVTAGDKISVWLNALNASSNQISWTFPPRIKSKMISSQGSFDGSLELPLAETNAVVIVPGAFARREYVSLRMKSRAD